MKEVCISQGNVVTFFRCSRQILNHACQNFRILCTKNY